ncbi:ABC-three component system protein [Sedimentibacter sp.]|uniref:ABC-three component system protein n=1 Tax=Sedimentibacter sp. TaxID=1960295 RepID=UPI0028AA7E0C|nr:ABC-three component system protein [Sedimentibacter sp.]
MLKKLRLDQTKKYEKHIALEELSNMLVSFVIGTLHNLSIGAEQGNIVKWDDFVIEKNDGGNIYIQVKRQTTDFSDTDPIIRDTYTRGKRVGESRDLSPLDESMESLANWINDTDFKNLNFKNEFRLILPEGSTKIKKGLEIRNLSNLLEHQYKSVTTAKDLENLSSCDKNVLNIYNWLTSWCGFSGWDHILKLMKVLKIRTYGTEPEILNRVKSNLSHIFKPTKLDTICSLIFSYIEDNETFAGAIRPRELLYQLKEYLLLDIERWTSFQNDNSNWNISGINDLKDNTEIERPSALIPALWVAHNPYARKLNIEGDCIENCCVSNSLIRLSLHAQGSFNIICSDKHSWINTIRNKTGGTLGVLKDDVDNLRILGELNPLTYSEKREIALINEQEQYADELHKEMYKCNFKYVEKGILKYIRSMKSGDLRTEIEKRWNAWNNLLESNIDEQQRLFVKIFHPVAEGETVSGELRVGPKTADLLSEAIFLLLIVSVCLSDDRNISWKEVKNDLVVNSIGLTYWSGPAEGARKIMKIDDDEGIEKLLEKESGDILIIPQSGLTETEVFGDDIFGETTRSSLLTHPKHPKLLITQDRIFKKNLNKGNISILRAYLQERLNKYENHIESEVERISKRMII